MDEEEVEIVKEMPTYLAIACSRAIHWHSWRAGVDRAQNGKRRAVVKECFGARWWLGTRSLLGDGGRRLRKSFALSFNTAPIFQSLQLPPSTPPKATRQRLSYVRISCLDCLLIVPTAEAIPIFAGQPSPPHDLDMADRVSPTAQSNPLPGRNVF